MRQPMRRALVAILLAAPVPATAEIRSTAQCEAAIASDPRLAREDAGQWARSGGGVEARICEAAALEAMGATATAARLLSGMATSPSRAIPRDLRTILLEDSARLWLEKGAPELALESLERADQAEAGGPERLRLRAEAEAAVGDWAGATEALDALIHLAPEDADAHALRAASLRHDGRLTMALWSAQAALKLSPELPEGLFEAGAAAAELQDFPDAEANWLTLIRLHPEHPLADAARRNLAALQANG
jgi:regulator of sirC expression with transglutaminase-like and TPR domain